MGLTRLPISTALARARQDLLYTSQPPGMRKRRAHFHVFMLDVHDRMHRMRTAGHAEADPLPILARELAADASLLCFDEFQVRMRAPAHNLHRTPVRRLTPATRCHVGRSPTLPTP